ncbi:hypothetical protein ADUPG1_012191 [Aduncisulcus paluster]|uniref:Uncharacterized protein n=1 Tax=Aduncisulcus paluster TaxID=2918883 RepID=A0ABQ5JYM9_9EUKA|nr:hypothetical protein ADUPG1_012191 [Aduncisulcus paluster]
MLREKLEEDYNMHAIKAKAASERQLALKMAPEDKKARIESEHSDYHESRKIFELSNLVQQQQKALISGSEGPDNRIERNGFHKRLKKCVSLTFGIS